MSYIIKKSNGETIQIPELVEDTSTNIRIPGRGLPQYGEGIAESLVRMLENFSSPNSPGSGGSDVVGQPLQGQLWFDSASRTLKVFDGNNFISLIDEDDPVGGSASSDKLTTPRNITLSGNASGSTLFDGSSDVSISVSDVVAKRLENPVTISLTGGASGSASFDGSGNITIDTTVSVDVPGSVEEAERLKTSRKIELTGDVSGETMFDGSNDVTIDTTIDSSEFLKKAYPVDSVYITFNNRNPSTIFGFGTWVSISGKFLIGYDATQKSNPRLDSVGQTGGGFRHSHQILDIDTSMNGSHQHTVGTDGWGSTQVDGGFPEPSTIGRLATGSGKIEDRERLESLSHASNSVSTSSSGLHSHSVSGNTQQVTSLPPYIVVYMWRRIT